MPMYEIHVIIKRHGKQQIEFVDENAELNALLNSLRECWLETAGEDEPESFIVLHEHKIVAVLNHGEDWRQCVTTHVDGRVERHFIEYLLDGDGNYVSTQISEVPPTPKPPAGWESVGTSIEVW